MILMNNDEFDKFEEGFYEHFNNVVDNVRFAIAANSCQPYTLSRDDEKETEWYRSLCDLDNYVYDYIHDHIRE